MKTKIIIIDDDVSVRNTLAQVLQAAGFETTCDASPTVQSLTDSHADIVIASMNANGTNSLDLLMSLHNFDPRPRILLYTGNHEVMALENFQPCVDGVLLKPATVGDLIEKIHHLLGK